MTVASGLGVGQKDTEVVGQELNALEKKCCRHLLQKRKQSENEDIQKKIRFIECRFRFAHFTLLGPLPCSMLQGCSQKFVLGV